LALFTNKHYRLTLENIQSSNGVVAHHLENEVQSAISTGSTEQKNFNDDEQEVDLEEEIEEGDADEDDVSSIKKKSPNLQHLCCIQ